MKRKNTRTITALYTGSFRGKLEYNISFITSELL